MICQCPARLKDDLEKQDQLAFALSRALPEARATADYPRRSAIVARHLKTRPTLVADKPNDFQTERALAANEEVGACGSP